MATTSTHHIYTTTVVITDLDLDSVAAHTTADQTHRIEGINGRILQVIEPSDLDGHLTIESVTCPKVGQATFRITNADGSAVDDTAKRYILIVTP